MATFVLAHLSDPHLAPLPIPTIGELASKRALGFFNWRRRRHLIHRAEVLARIVADIKAQAPDHIAVTGDLVNISLAAEYRQARAWLDALGSPEQVTLVPGNHDAYVRAAAGDPQHYWGDYMSGDDIRVPGNDAPFPFVRRRGPLALIGLSTAVPTAPFMATGRLGGAQLDRLGPLLDRMGVERLCRVVLIHHPPTSPLSRHHKRLVDGMAFRDVLSCHGAELVLHGHDHVHSLTWLDGPSGRIPAFGVPSASGAADGKHEPAAYNLYRIERDGAAWRCEAISRGLAPDGSNLVETRRLLLAGEPVTSQ
jgi:3',5'-cyclic AMP phosphodiesterase CpdA